MNKVLSSTQESHPNFASRRSQRRINKLIQKNISEYQIPNPYRTHRSNQYLPSNLGKQLFKVDFLSVKSLHNLNFADPTVHDKANEMLLKMRQAVSKQAEQLRAYVYDIQQKPKKYSENTLNDDICPQKCQNQQEHHEQKYFSSQNSIELELQAQQSQRDIPLVSIQSECVSIMSDNYESERLIFKIKEDLDEHVLQQVYEL